MRSTRTLSRFAVTPALLSVALGVAIAMGDTGDALVIAALLVPGVVLFAAVWFVLIRYCDRE